MPGLLKKERRGREEGKKVRGQTGEREEGRKEGREGGKKRGKEEGKIKKKRKKWYVMMETGYQYFGKFRLLGTGMG
jgi:hypothetical protein